MRPPPWPVQLLTLFTCSINKARARTLLEGLSEEPRRRAALYAEVVLSWKSPARKAVLAREFGEAPGAVERLRATFREAGPLLQSQMLGELPPFHRSLFASLKVAQREPGSPALRALAKSWVHEATRGRT